jgi:hypothetical protein
MKLLSVLREWFKAGILGKEVEFRSRLINAGDGRLLSKIQAEIQILKMKRKRK